MSDAELLAQVNGSTPDYAKMSDSDLLAQANRGPSMGTPAKKETISWRQGKKETVWDKIQSLWPEDSAAQSAKATNALVYSEMLNISPSKAYDYHDEISQQVRDKLAHEKIVTERRGVKGTVSSAIDTSLLGMMRKRQVPEPFESVSGTERLMHGLITIGLDTPFYMAGYAIGGGTPLSGMAGAFGFHAGMRQVLVDKYSKGEVKSLSDWLDRTKSAAMETIKGEVVGGFTGGMGEMAGPLWKAMGTGTSSPIGWKAINELATMTAAGRLIEGEIPTARDFIENAAMLMAIHAGAKGYRSSKEGIARVKAKLQQAYVETGAHPKKIVEQALNDSEVGPERPVEKVVEKVVQEIKATMPPEETGKVSPEGEKAQPGAKIEAEAGKPVNKGSESAPKEKAPEPEGTSIKNASVDAEREAMGLPPIETPIRTGGDNWKQEVKDGVENGAVDHRRIAEKVNNIVEAGEPVPALTVEENYALGVGKDLMKKQKRELSRQIKELEDRQAPPDEVEPLKYERSQLEESISANQKATKATGTAWSDIGNVRQEFNEADFSVEAMVQRAEADGVEVSPRLRSIFDKISKEIEKAQDDLDSHLDDVAAGRIQETVTKVRKKEGLTKRKQLRADEVKAIDAEFESLVAKLKGLAGDQRGSISFKKKADPETSAEILIEMARNRIKKGLVKAEDIVDSIYTALSGAGVSLSKRQIQDAISNYGVQKKMSQEELDVALREAKRQMRLLSALEDAKEGKVPEKTGLARDPKSDRVRELTREINKAMRESGIEQKRTPDQEKRWKTALDAAKTRLTNEIADLEKAIAEKKPIEGVKGEPVKYDEEALDLRKQRDELKKDYEAIFGGKVLTTEQKVDRALKILDKAIEYRTRQVASGKVEAPKRTPDEAVEQDPRVVEKKKELEDLKGKVDEIRKKAKGPGKTEEEKSVERQMKATQREIDNLKSEILTNAPRKQPKPSYTSKELEDLKAERDALRETKKNLIEMEEYEMTPDEQALSDFRKRTEKQIEKYEKATEEHDFSKRGKKDLPPLTKKELALRFKLEQAKQRYAEARFDAEYEQYGVGKKIGYFTREAMNVARALKTSFDVSAVLRQGGFIVLSHPIRGAKALPAMFKAMRSPEGQFAIEQEIKMRPNAPLYEKYKLFLSGHGKTLSQMEEVYMSRWAEHLPGVAASERAYVTFLNRLRADSFDAMARNWGKDGKLTDAQGEALANFINVATGRGSVPGNEHTMANALANANTVFFAPRYVLSRFQLLLGQPMRKGTFQTRTAIAKEYGRFLGGLGVVYFLGLAAGAELEIDPRSADFGKLVFGNTRVDPLSGISQSAVLLSRVITGETVNKDGEVIPLRGEEVKYGGSNTADVLGRFLRSKLSPVLGTSIDVIAGKDVVGNEVTLYDVPEKLLMPLTLKDVYETMVDQGVPMGAALSLVGIFGMGLMTYDERKD